MFKKKHFFFIVHVICVFIIRIVLRAGK